MLIRFGVFSAELLPKTLGDIAATRNQFKSARVQVELGIEN
jgi:hypothetical protein